ncbi:MAG TPA: ABC transporter substrate-binding protein, partial [Steroidobacteraceae bacterium]|nr:ABC transporter substrate-binding protein [Steroidobacteraceae bacterium]
MKGTSNWSRRWIVTGLALGAAVLSAQIQAKPLKLEKEQIKIGFIKLTDMVPLAVAYEKGF